MAEGTHVNVVVQSAISGDTLWSGRLGACCTACDLGKQVALAAGRPGQVLILHYEGTLVAANRRLLDVIAGECFGSGYKHPDELSFSGVWSSATWPVASSLLQVWLERSLEPYLEKPARWRQLQSAQALRGFVRGLLKKLDADLGKLAAGSAADAGGHQQVLEMLGLPVDSLESMPHVKERLQHLWSLADRTETEATLQELVAQICRQAAIRDQQRAGQLSRRLVQWPSKRGPKLAVALFLAANLWELDTAGSLQAAEVDEAVNATFIARPDLPLIRRSLLELNLIKQPRLSDARSTTEFQLCREAAQKLLDETLPTSS